VRVYAAVTLSLTLHRLGCLPCCRGVSFVEKYNVAILPILNHVGDYSTPPMDQGAYVYRLGPSAFELIRKLTHFDDDKSFDDAIWLGRDMYDQRWEHSALPGRVVRRTLTMDDYLYTVSNNRLGIVNMANGFGDVGSVELVEA